MKIRILIVMVLGVLVLFGCPSAKVPAQRISPDKITIIGGGPVPQEIVGAWESKPQGWGIKIEPDGSIKRILHNIAGAQKLDQPPQVLKGPDPGTEAIFIMGEVSGTYEPNSRQLQVNINLDSYSMTLPGGKLEGRSEDTFDGKISDDGQKWEAIWLGFSWLEGATPPDVEAIMANPETLTFYKVDLTQPPAVKEAVETQSVQ